MYRGLSDAVLTLCRRGHRGHFSNGYALSASTGVLDALYQRDGAWMLVEFKTDRVHDVAEAESLL